MTNGPSTPGGEIPGFVSELFAGLVELFRNRGGRRAVFQRDGQKGIAWPCHRLDTVVIGQLLNTLFKRLSDEILHLACRRTRPHSCHGQSLDGEGGVLRPPELDEGIDACGGQQEDEKQGDGPLANRNRGKIEAHQLLPLPEAVRTRAPSCRR